MMRLNLLIIVVLAVIRQIQCGSKVTEQVPFLMAKNRKKVKHTLGPLFNRCKLDHMGEEAIFVKS